MTKQEVLDSMKEKVEQVIKGNQVLNKTFYYGSFAGRFGLAKLVVEKKRANGRIYEVELDLTEDFKRYAKAA